MITKYNSTERTVYCLKRKSNSLIFYIGVTEQFLKDRLLAHISLSKNLCSSKVSFEINEVIKNGDSVEIEALCWFSSDYQSAIVIEQSYISAAISSGVVLFNSYVMCGRTDFLPNPFLTSWAATIPFLQGIFKSIQLNKSQNDFCLL